MPLLRGHHPPEFVARGAMVGLGVAFTPLVGVQMPIVFALWVLARKLGPARDFNLVVALAWTWVTNAVTAPLVYYLFLVTGRLMLGRWERIRGFDAFQTALARAAMPDDGVVETLVRGFTGLFHQFGLPMFVGCLPWVVIMGWLGYRGTYALVVQIRAKRARRRHRRNEAARQSRVIKSGE